MPANASLAQVAQYAGVSIKTVRRWVADGRLPAYRVGKRLIRVDLADADACFRQIPTIRQAG